MSYGVYKDTNCIYSLCPVMKKIVLFLSITLFGWVGWALGDRFGLMTAYFTSVAGSLVGVYIGCRINRDYLS